MGCSPWGCKELDTTEQLSTGKHRLLCVSPFQSLFCILQGKLQPEIVCTAAVFIGFYFS